MVKDTVGNKTILYLANVKIHHLLFNLPLMLEMKKRGWQVVAVSVGAEEKREFSRHGITYIGWELDKGGKNIFKDWKSYKQIIQTINTYKPDIIHTFTIKANIYGALAAKKLGVKKIICTITGLGYIFTDDNFTTLPVRLLAQKFYLFALNKATKVIFFNRDDKKLIGTKIKTKKVMLPSGAGIDTKYFSPNQKTKQNSRKLLKSLRIPEKSKVILTICRLLKHKGIIEFLEAGKSIFEKFPNTYFLVAGEIDLHNPSAISKRELSKLSFSNLRLLGQCEDIKEVIAACDIFVLASYREGMPRSILEAMSMGKPVITTIAPGCDQLVKNNIDGLKIPVKNTGRLEKSIEMLLVDRKLRLELGKNARQKITREFKQEISVVRTLKIYGNTEI